MPANAIATPLPPLPLIFRLSHDASININPLLINTLPPLTVLHHSLFLFHISFVSGEPTPYFNTLKLGIGSGKEREWADKIDSDHLHGHHMSHNNLVIHSIAEKGGSSHENASSSGNPSMNLTFASMDMSPVIDR